MKGESAVKLFLFLDDWFLDSKRDVVRRFYQAKPTAVPHAHKYACMSIIYDEARRCFRGWSRQEKSHIIFESGDGLEWKLARRLNPPAFRNSPILYPFEHTWFYDKWDADQGRRYKMLGWFWEKGLEGGPGLIAYSRDGIKWTVSPEAWHSHAYGSDTVNNIFYNPKTKRWCVVCRIWNTDRRVAMVESGDLTNWTAPREILHPDALDPDLLQFYGMPAVLYEEEYFIGMLQCYHVSMDEVNPWSRGRVKMRGKVDAQLTYSYDGLNWLRSDRSLAIPELELGEYGAGGIYPMALIPRPAEGKFYIYSIGTLKGHGRFGIPKGYPANDGLLLHKLRQDGFAYLTPVGGYGQFTTRTIVPKSGSLTVNYETAVGEVRVQVTDSLRKPLRGYTFADSEPLCGDEIYGKVRWKNKKDMSELIGRPVHLEFRMLDARIYGVRTDCNLAYTKWQEIEHI
jgi:hypothetical protein